jgi:hypothetical protein
MNNVPEIKGQVNPKHCSRKVRVYQHPDLVAASYDER